jgi:hypothetical protein
MTQEEKDFLIRDLCARLPYGVKLHCSSNVITCIGPYTLDTIVLDRFCNKNTEYVPFDEVKPYLFPLSSITEEQEAELAKLGVSYGDYALHDSIFRLGISVDEAYIFFEFCYKHHIDFLGLIDLGLAIDATGLNIY